MNTPIQTTLSVLAGNFLALDRAYRLDADADPCETLDDMVAISRAAIVIESAHRVSLWPFCQSVSGLRRTHREDSRFRVSQIKKAEAAMDVAREAAVVVFRAMLTPDDRASMIEADEGLNDAHAAMFDD